MLRNSSINEADPYGHDASTVFFEAVLRDGCAPSCPETHGSVMLMLRNGTSRRRLVGYSTPIDGHSCKRVGAGGVFPTQIVPLDLAKYFVTSHEGQAKISP